MAKHLEKKSPKKHRPKGRPLSEKLGQKGLPGVPGGALHEEFDESEEEKEEEQEERDEEDEEEAEERDADDDEADEGDGEADDEEREPAAAAGAEGDEERTEADEAAPSSRGKGEEPDDEELGAAAQMGHTRYVMAGFFGLWLVGAYILGRVLEGLWGWLSGKDFFMRRFAALAAVPDEGDLVSRASLSLVLGALISTGIVFYYYRQPDVHQWADEVAEELSKVKWPTRKEVGNNTVVVIATTTVLTLILFLLDRFFAFVSDIVYSVT